MPVRPADLVIGRMRRLHVNAGTKVSPYAAFLHVDSATGTRTIWLMLNGILYKSPDDAAHGGEGTTTWLEARGGATETSPSGLGWEGVFVSSAGRLYLASGDGQTIRYKDLSADGSDLADSTLAVRSVAVTAGGAGYLDSGSGTFEVLFTGGEGSGAAATATVASGVITAITVTESGTGYTSNPTVDTETNGGRVGGSAATTNVTRGFDCILCSDETHNFQFPARDGAAYGAHFNKWSIWEVEYPWEAVGGLEIGDIVVGTYHRSTDQVTAVAITNGGTGYSDSFAVTFTGGGGSGAEGTATAVGGVIQSVTMTYGGRDYTSTPTAVFTAGGGASGAGSVSLGRKIAYLYVIRDGIINADYASGDVDSASYMRPDPLAAQGDPFATWNDQMGEVARHIHHVCIGTDGYVYFSTGDQAVGINWAVGDTANHYRHCRIYPGGDWEQLAGAGNGFTAMLLRDDGTRIMGNDVDSYGSGQTQYIERWSGATKIDRPYSPEGAWADWPVWDITEIGAWGAGTGVLYATVQRVGDTSKVGSARAALLKSVDGGATWRHIAISSPDNKTGNWFDVDYIVSDRRRRIPADAPRFMILCQPDGAGDQANNDSRYYVVTI